MLRPCSAAGLTNFATLQLVPELTDLSSSYPVLLGLDGHGNWGAFCYSSFSNQVGDLICRQLGNNLARFHNDLHGSGYDYMNGYDSVGPQDYQDGMAIWPSLSTANCPSNATRLEGETALHAPELTSVTDCMHFVETPCPSSDRVVIDCYGSKFGIALVGYSGGLLRAASIVATL
mgnify:CR=1 FL=1